MYKSNELYFKQNYFFLFEILKGEVFVCSFPYCEILGRIKKKLFKAENN